MSDLEDYSSVDSFDSDSELQQAFAKGLLKPGLNRVIEVEKKIFKNHVVDLKRKLREFKLALGWIERLDIISGLAPLAPELAFKLGEQERKRENELRNAKKDQNLENDPVINEFRREMNFHRQAQAAVLMGIPKLQELGIPTKRPDDYFAQMAKTDDHMHKVRQVLQKKQISEALSEKARKQRQLRKVGKQVQIETRLRREAEKRKLAQEVKKYRKGIRTDLGFLNEDGAKAKTKGSQTKRNSKNKKFGFGGKKRGLKRNTKASYAGDDGEQRKGAKRGPPPKQKGAKRGPPPKQRLGKHKRVQLKSRKSKK